MGTSKKIVSEQCVHVLFSYDTESPWYTGEYGWNTAALNTNQCTGENIGW
jgi:hypothetical protein